MDLTTEHRDLLRAVAELETPKGSPGTKAAGQRLLDIWTERGRPYSWHASAPWHGTSPYADELRSEGLLEVHVGMATVRRSDQPAGTTDQYALALTDTGRQLLAETGRG